MHTHLCTYKYTPTRAATTGFWLLATLMQPKAKASVLTQPLVSSFLASYWGSTKLCLQHFYDFSLLALLLSLNYVHRVYSILQTLINCLDYVLNYSNSRIHCMFFIHDTCCSQLSVLCHCSHCPFLSVGVFAVCAEKMKYYFNRRCSGSWATEVTLAGQQDNTDLN